LGRLIQDGASRVRIFNEEVGIRCAKKVLGGFSAHADQPRLMEWVMPMRNKLKKLFVVQGEPQASAVLVQKVRDDLAVDALAPKTGEEFVL